MNDSHQSMQNALREKIEMEKKTDHLIRRISKIAWGGTIFFIIVFIGFTGYEIFNLWGLYKAGFVPASSIFNELTPFLISLGGASFVVSIVSTIGVFLRLRTSTLSEIQVRLAALENILLDRAEG